MQHMQYNFVAHVKWFVDEHSAHAHALDSIEWLVIAGLLAVGVAVLWGIHRFLIRAGVERYFDMRLGKYARFVPYIVRYTTGALFIINAAKALLFAPNVPASATPIGLTLSVMLAIVGVMLIIGYRVRVAAGVILAVYTIALFAVQPTIDVLDHIEYVGIGLYLLLQGVTYPKFLSKKSLEPYISPAGLLRVFVGIDLMILALSEKLIGIANSTEFLEQYHWNFMAFAGISDRDFIIIAGVVELLVGLTLVLNIAPRLTTAIVAGLMALTAALLGVEEVFGHLFAFSLVAVVWLNTYSSVKKTAKKSHRARKV